MSSLLQDLRHAARALAKHPAYFVTALLTLALGIGFSTAMFSVINAVLLRAQPYREPSRLVVLRERSLPQFPQFSVSPGHYLFWRDHNTAFESIGAYGTGNANLDIGDGSPERVRADRVTANLFPLLGVNPLFGRGFLDADDREGAPRVVLLSYGVWQRRFGGQRTAVGQAIRMDREPATIVGVMPPGFAFPSANTEMWVPMAFTGSERITYGSHYLSAIGRLKPGATLESAEADMKVVSRRLVETVSPGSKGWEVLLFDLQAFTVAGVRRSLYVLLGAVTLVLLIACVNVANLLLVRGAARHRELAIRSAIGASRLRLLRQLIVEQLALATVSAAGGVLIAAWLVRALLAMVPDALPRQIEIGVDGQVLAFALGLAALTPLLFG
ncbi:MAG TPA: ABC transporter permease, partial [Candidatus Dormibacteraeota bacterium]|nr:ABC transporter permease [Candidatus Dormibacteraeota bacterium]